MPNEPRRDGARTLPTNSLTPVGRDGLSGVQQCNEGFAPPTISWTSIKTKLCSLFAHGSRFHDHDVVGHNAVAGLLRELGYSLRSNRKTREGSHHPDRDAQFGYLNAQMSDALAAGQPVISVDTKKKGVLQRHGKEFEKNELKAVSQSCVEDDGRPIGISFQERVPNQSEPLR